MNLFLEYLTIWSFIKIIFFKKLIKKKYKINNINYYYIDATIIAKTLIKILKIFFYFNINKFNFKMIEIKDDNSELIRLRLFRKDLYDFQKKIISLESYKIYHKKYSNHKNLNQFLLKSFIYHEVFESFSVSRVLFLINVINYNSKNLKNKKNILVINKRPWFNIYKDYSHNLNIDLFQSNLFSPIIILLKEFKLKFLSIYRFLFKNNYNLFFFNFKKNKYSKPLLYVLGRGDIHFKKDEKNSDFFWQLNSKFPKNNILYKYLSNYEMNNLILNKVNITKDKINYIRKKNYKSLSISNKFKNDLKTINKEIKSYNTIFNYWNSFFKTYNVKIFFSWFLYDKNHIAISEAIKNNQGISAIWQMAFNGTPYVECITVSDIFFTYSNLTSKINNKTGSKCKYQVITGYPKDYAFSIIKNKDKEVRKKLESAGAQNIIAIFDENSQPDDRWHTGVDLQIENYEYAINKILKNPKLGVIFKPKSPKTLRKRLYKINQLLDEAIATGRCHIFEETSRYTSAISPVYAGFNADIAVHSHLSAGTAAIECALNNIRTLLIDREGVPFDLLNELPKNKIVFNSWEKAFDNILEYFESEKQLKDFGDWSSYLDLFDPFRDGKAAYRIGTYLESILDGYKNNKDREIIMQEAAESYADKWGEDKIIINNE